jgi:AraC-like DNA-binding protein
MWNLAPVDFGRQRRDGLTVLSRHRHRGSYLALVLSGGYEEAGDRGRHRVRAGDIVFHGGFEAHLNRYDATGAEVLNLALPEWMEPQTALMQTADPDMAVRLAERDPREAVHYLVATMRPLKRDAADWPDELAMDLASNPHLRLNRWALQQGLASETVSRGFRRVYGLSPSAYRAQMRGRMAWRRAMECRESLSQLAAETGFSDQSHMTRMVHLLTGQTPAVWRRYGKQS